MFFSVHKADSPDPGSFLRIQGGRSGVVPSLATGLGQNTKYPMSQARF
jgi:hypothetical protein